MDGRFLDAFTLLPSQRVICGYATKPLCLRHRIVLTALNSPFVDGRGDIAPKHILIASKILSATTLAEMMTINPSEKDIQEARKLTDDTAYFNDQLKQVYETIKQQSRWPIFWNKSNKGGGKGVPWILSVICGLVKGGVSLEEAWTMPESQAIWMQAAMAIGGGADIDILSDSDIVAQEQLKEIYARLEANSNG